MRPRFIMLIPLYLTNKLICNMIDLLTELQEEYKDNINIRRC